VTSKRISGRSFDFGRARARKSYGNLPRPKETSPVPEAESIVVSVVVLNYNGAKWIEKCIDSVLTQSLRQIELIVADNLSTDGSDVTAARLLAGKINANFIQHGANLGYCEGNNRAVWQAKGKYILLLNNDAWLEQDCLEVLIKEVEAAGAAAATPLVMNWSDNEFQWVFVCGFDVFGLPSFRIPPKTTEHLFMPPGCSYLIRRDLYVQFGGLDPAIFMYADEWDLSWKVWLSGHSAVVVPGAHCHHRGAVNVNPTGGERVVEYRTSETKRYYANRNCLLVLAKDAQNILLLLIPLQLMMLICEMLAAGLLIRRWSFMKRSYLQAIGDFLRLMPHIRKERAKVRSYRKRSDLYMLRFLRFRLSRWDEIMQVLRMGVPKVVGR
jgi:GT2 family glycosyltransferase